MVGRDCGTVRLCALTDHSRWQLDLPVPWVGETLGAENTINSHRMARILTHVRGHELLYPDLEMLQVLAAACDHCSQRRCDLCCIFAAVSTANSLSCNLQSHVASGTTHPTFVSRQLLPYTARSHYDVHKHIYAVWLLIWYMILKSDACSPEI